MIKTKIIKIKGDWQEVLNDCRFTVGKAPLETEPTEKFKKAILIAEHSVIRDISIKWVWEGMKHWVVVHWVRHKWEKFVRTQRTDRTGVSRDELPQSEPSDFTGEANSQALIDTMRKRLCYQASHETRESAESLKITTHEVEPEISDVMVPNCIYRGGCPEDGLGLSSCSFYSHFVDACSKVGCDVTKVSIQERYDLYNAYFYEHSKSYGGCASCNI